MFPVDGYLQALRKIFGPGIQPANTIILKNDISSNVDVGLTRLQTRDYSRLPYVGMGTLHKSGSAN